MASTEYSNLATAKTILSTVGSIAATAMVIRSVSQDYIPPEFQSYISSSIRNFFNRFSNELTLVVEEYQGLVSNEIYKDAEIYLGPKISPKTRRLQISRPENEKHMKITMERDEEIVDFYQGEKFRWVLISKETFTNNLRERNSTSKYEVRSFELTFHRKNKDLVIDSYLPYISNEAQIMKQEKRTIRILTVDFDNIYDISNLWTHVTLDHPANFDTLAMDLDLKNMIIKDLDQFVKRRDYYRRVGKAWKRGYLLYGPPGTGKSSLIAAMANYLNFDVYDLELAQLSENSELRKVLLGTANKSILVVEDIDCTIELQENLANRESSNTPPGFNFEENKVTLSGLLNLIDGLWSSCGEERIIIFTTNHIEKLDPALLRPGRMDVHINLSYCTPSGFKILTSNYLGVKDHVRFQEIENLIECAKVTPAEVAEQLLKNDEPDVCLQGLVDYMFKKIRETEEKEAKEATLAVESVEKLKNYSRPGRLIRQISRMR